MIQFYINSRPVPRAIARHHLELGLLDSDLVKVLLTQAVKGDKPALRHISDYGISVVEV